MYSRIVLAIIGLAVSALIAEAFLRCLPVATGYNYQLVNSEHPVLQGLPFSPYTYSRGWNFRVGTKGVLNNDGFISNINYQRGGQRTALFIGDSFVQAAAVPSDRNVHSLLSEKLAPARVFGLSRAGGSLPDYLALAAWGIEKYRPDALVFLIVNGDLEESLTQKHGGYHFSKTDAGYLLTRSDRLELTAAQKLLNASMLFRYFYDNLAFTVSFPRRHPAPPTHVNNNPARLKKYHEITSFFLSEISRIFPSGKIIILTYRIRYGMTDSTDVDVNVLRDDAKLRGFQVIDLAEAFAKYEEATHNRLDYYPADSHWNELGHQWAARSVESALRTLFR